MESETKIQVKLDIVHYCRLSLQVFVSDIQPGATRANEGEKHFDMLGTNNETILRVSREGSMHPTCKSVKTTVTFTRTA